MFKTTTLTLIFFSLMLAACSSKPLPQKNSKPIKAKAVQSIAGEQFAYVVFDVNKKVFLEGKNLNLVRPIASVTKLMTAIVFLEERRGGQCQTKILQSDGDFIKGTTSPLPKNVNIACQELLKAMLVRSDNYAAHALAHATRLSKAQFIQRMNTKARELGMKQTFFADSSGLSPKNVSTVSDLAKLSAYAMTKAEIQQLSNMPSVTVYAGGKALVMQSTNRMIRNQSYPALVSKTGYTREAGFNLAYIYKGLCQGKRLGVISLNHQNATARADFTEGMLEKYRCRL